MLAAPMLYSPDESTMSSTVPFLNPATLSIVLHLLVIFAIALLLNRFFQVLSNLLIKPATGQSRAEQLREQQTRALAGVVYSVASKVVWVVAILTALDKVGINPTPALALAGLSMASSPIHGQDPFPKSTRPMRPGEEDPNPLPNGKSPAKIRLEENQKDIRKDIEKLFDLASQLKQQVEKTDAIAVLSLAMVKKADEIERLAHQIKERAKG